MFSDITAPDYGDFTSDVVNWLNNSLCYNFYKPDGGTTEHEINPTVDAECCIIFPKSNFTSSYGSSWDIRVYSVATDGSIVSEYFTKCICEDYVVFIYQGVLGTDWTTDIVVEFYKF